MTQSRLTVLLLLSACVPATAQSQQDQLFLQDGRERVGRLVTMTDDIITFEVGGTIQSIKRADVQRLELGASRTGDTIRTVRDLNDPILDHALELGAATFVFRDSGHVTLYHLIERRVQDDGSYTETERVIRKVLQERGKGLANVTAYYRTGIDRVEVDFARTINSDASVTPITETAVDVTSVHADTPEYERQHQLKFAMKQVVEGSVLDYQLTTHANPTNLLEPLTMGMFFREAEPIMEKELRIILPVGRKLQHSLRQAKNVRFKETSSHDGTVYSFVARNVSRYVPEAQMPPLTDCMPRVLVAESASWTDIGAAFHSSAMAQGQLTPAIKDKVRDLSRDASNTEETLANIYHFVTQSIRQVWIGPSAYQYAPNPVGDIFERRAGNTIDKVNLLRSMLVEAGVDAQIVLCRTRGRGRLVEEVPTIRQLDDALVRATVDGHQFFLGVDDETVRLGQLSSEYQGTRGLMITSQDSKLIDIPLFAADAESVASTYAMAISSTGDLVVTETQRPTGNMEMGYRASWKDTKEEDLRKGLEMALSGMHATARLTDFQIQNLRDVTKPLVFSQTYTLTDYALGNEDLLVLRIPVLDYHAAAVGQPTREYGLVWDQRFKSTKNLTITFPAGYRVYYAGKNCEATSDPATFVARFEHTSDAITYVDEYNQRLVEAPPSSYKGYKACLETMARVPKEWIVLEKLPTP